MKEYLDLPGGLKGEKIVETLFKGKIWIEDDWRNTQLSSCSFVKCQLSQIKLEQCRMHQVIFKECKLSGLKFYQLDPMLLSFQFEKCVLIGCNFSHLKLPHTSFLECNIQSCDFVETQLSGACFKEATFKDTRFHQCNLRKADFSGASSYEINPMSNQLQKAIFSMPEAMSLLFHLDIVIR